MSTTPAGAASATQVPDFLAQLGLKLPVSVADVQEAYRQKAKVAHPDLGGNQQQFIELQLAYERALAYASFRSGRARWLAASVERYMEHEALVADVERLGGHAQTERIDWLADTIGEDFAQVLDQIVGLRLRGMGIDDTTIDELVEKRNLLAALHWLDLSDSRLTDAGLLRLQYFGALRTLIVRDTQVTAVGLQVIGRLPHLTHVYTGGTAVSWWGRYRLRRSHPHVHIGA